MYEAVRVHLDVLRQAVLLGAGWQQHLDDAGTRDELPEGARRYVELVERELEVPVELVGVGAARERVLA